jgi:hypothetical protein
MQDMAAFFGKWTLSRYSDEGVLQMVCHSRLRSAPNQIRCGGFVNPRSSMPALSAYSSPLAPYAEHTSGSALLDAGALCHPPPLPAPSRQPAFNESKLSPRLRNFNHANRVRELRSTCDGRSAALELCVVVSGIKLRWCLRTEDSECLHKIPLMKDAGECHDFDPNIYLNTFA